jgi:DNA invertase Pin-like site-specific DNA recombinase
MTAASKSRPEEDVLYLRKSRADIEMESQGEIDILARHEAQLLTNARRLGRSITQIYREVVSGDTIAERPLMQQLLQEVEAGRWAAVHVVEVERLARGDTMDQGLIERVFRYSDTKIITPLKTYDPLNIFDRQYLQFGLFMSRFEYETIKRRMQNGRIASVNEGKWPANIAPYGYRRVKLEKQKGWTLEIVPEEADVVKSIYRWYTSGELGVSLIVRRLNDAGFISPRGKDWTNSLVRDILSNVAYAGWVRWGNRPAIKKIKNGDITISRPRSSQALIGKGLHPAIVTQEVFDMAQTRLSENPSRPGPKQMKMKNRSPA